MRYELNTTVPNSQSQRRIVNCSLFYYIGLFWGQRIEMGKCNTNCVEKPIANGFAKLGRVVARYPWVFLILPLITSAGLGAGFYFLEDRESNDIEEQFTPKNGPAKTERAYIEEHFPHDEEFSTLRLYTDGTFASLIAVHPTNILDKSAMQFIEDLDTKVKQIQGNGSKLTFQDLCAKKNGQCVGNPILDLMNANINNDKPIYFPRHNEEFTAAVLGGVNTYPNDTIESAQAIRMFYYLTEEKKNETDLWLRKFTESLSSATKHNKVNLKRIRKEISMGINRKV